MSSKRRWSVLFSLLFILLAGTVGAARWFRPRIDVQALQRQVEGAIASKDFDTAGQLADRLIKRNPRNATALLQRGRICAANERWEEALAFFGRIPDQSALAADARYFEGLTYLEMQRARLAEEALLKAMELAPEHLRTHEQLAALYASQLRVDAMRGHLNAILAARTWSLEELTWFVTGGLTWWLPAPRVGEMQSYFQADPTDIDSAITLVQLHLSLDQTAEADAVLRKLSERFPDEPRVRALLAESALQHNDLGSAAEALSFVPADTPMLLWLARGQYAAVAGHLDDAVECLSEAVRLAPDNIQACYRLGRALKETGQEESAEPYLERAKLLDRLDHRCMLALGAESQSAVDFVLTEIGDLLMRLERWVEAALAFERLVAREDASPDLRQKYIEARQRFDESRLPGRGVPAASSLTYRPVRATNAAAARESPSGIASVRFMDRHREAGVDFRYFTGETGLRYLLESMGGGVAAFDFDGDGWPDLFFPQGTRLPVDPIDRTHLNGLFRNQSGAKFEDVTDRAGLDEPGYGIGCSTGDYDNDGFQDLFVSRFGTNLLYHNNGDGTFTDVTDAAGISGQHLSSSVAFADLDRDGSLDLFVVTYLDFDSCLRVCRNQEGRAVTCHPRAIAADQDILYQNRGDGTFSDVTESAGITAPEGKGLGVVVADLDEDGWPDLYVADDTTPNLLYRNHTGRSGDGRTRLQFEEVGVVSGAALAGDGQAKAGMGIACADLDGNGHLDLYVTNFFREYNTLYLNFGNLSFRDETGKASLIAPTLPVLGFGTQAIDVDLNGWPDLFVANGHVEDVRERGDPWKMPPQFFYNLGNAYFADLSRECGTYFQGEYLGRGVSRLDWDRDGRPDLVVVHQDRPAGMLHNETAAGSKVVIDLVGQASNRDAVNARLIVTAGGRSQIIEICGGDGYLSTNERRQVIGLGDSTEIDDLEIRWPSGRTEHLKQVPANCRFLIVEGRRPLIEPLAGSQDESKIPVRSGHK